MIRPSQLSIWLFAFALGSASAVSLAADREGTQPNGATPAPAEPGGANPQAPDSNRDGPGGANPGAGSQPGMGKPEKPDQGAPGAAPPPGTEKDRSGGYDSKKQGSDKAEEEW